MSPINKKNDTALTLRSVTKSYDGQPVLSDLSGIFLRNFLLSDGTIRKRKDYNVPSDPRT